MSLPFRFGLRPNRHLRHPRTAELPRLDYPLSTPVRIAVLGDRFRRERGVISLPAWDAARLERCHPLALAGRFEELSLVAHLRAEGRLTLEGLSYPLLVLRHVEEGPLTEPQHEQLWTWFGLPVFQQIRDAAARLIAYECEARDGFHLAHAAADPTKTGGACACGRAGSLIRVDPRVALPELLAARAAAV
jgi:hypothetical protein